MDVASIMCILDWIVRLYCWRQYDKVLVQYSMILAYILRGTRVTHIPMLLLRGIKVGLRVEAVTSLP